MGQGLVLDIYYFHGCVTCLRYFFQLDILLEMGYASEINILLEVPMRPSLNQRSLWFMPDSFYAFNWDAPTTPYEWGKWTALVRGYVEAKQRKDYQEADLLRKTLREWQGTYFSDQHYEAMVREGRYKFFSWEYSGKYQTWLSAMWMKRWTKEYPRGNLVHTQEAVRHKFCGYRKLISGVYDLPMKHCCLYTSEDSIIHVVSAPEGYVGFSIKDRQGNYLGVYFLRENSKLYHLRSAKKAGWVFV